MRHLDGWGVEREVEAQEQIASPLGLWTVDRMPDSLRVARAGVEEQSVRLTALATAAASA